MIEIELTYLAKYLPKDLKNAPSKRIVDIYYPIEAEHPTLRLRDNGGKYELTKKMPVSGTDSSIQREETIILNEAEYRLFLTLPGKKLEKTRYFYQYGEFKAEVDLFSSDLSGLALVDFEFETPEQKNVFLKPEFCLVEVTQDPMIAGGILAGKSYNDIEPKLISLGYQKIHGLH